MNNYNDEDEFDASDFEESELADMQAMQRLAQEHGVPVHLDGARLWNAATALQLPISAQFASVHRSWQLILPRWATMLLLRWHTVVIACTST